MQDTTTRPSVAGLSERLLRDAGTIDLADGHARLFIHGVRRLAAGRPLSDADVTALAAGQGLTLAEANESLKWLAERNDDGDIIGLGGLSLGNWGHHFRVDGRDLTTWCALDTLYLPQLLKLPVAITSPDPVTGEEVAVTIGTDGTIEAPATAVISIVVPKIDHQGLESAEQIWMAFCNYSLYFASEANGRAWFAGKNVEPFFLTVAEGMELGRQWLQPIIRYA